MNPKEKYDAIIQMIEDIVEKREKADGKLVSKLARENLLDGRELTALFKFMLDKTVLKYIDERKMIAAYKSIVESKKLDIETAIDISGYDNHSSFDKGFKSAFGMTPSEAYEAKNFDLVLPPQTWDVVSLDLYCRIFNQAEVMELEKKKFNIPVDTYEKVVLIEELRAIYDLPTMYEELIPELVEKLDLIYEDAFEYANALHEYGGDFAYGEESEVCGNPVSPQEKLRKEAFDPYHIFIFFECDLSLAAGWELKHETGFSQEELLAEPPEILAEYVQWNYTDHIQYQYFKAGYLYYQENATEEYDEENYDDYMTSVCAGRPKEIVFENLIPNNLGYDVYTYDDLKLDMEIADEIAAEEMQQEREKWLFQ